MSVENEVDNLIKENMSEDGYTFWVDLKKRIPPIWNRPTSSTGKYHLKENGKVPTVLEHTYEMLYSCCKVMKLFKVKPHTQEADLLLLGILLHDAFKYGIDDPLFTRFTDKTHDRIIANKIQLNRDIFLKIITEKQVSNLEHMVRFHSGIWSTDAKKDNEFSLSNLSPEAFFIHILDMLSANNCLRMPIEVKSTEIKSDVINNIIVEDEYDLLSKVS